MKLQVDNMGSSERQADKVRVVRLFTRKAMEELLKVRLTHALYEAAIAGMWAKAWNVLDDQFKPVLDEFDPSFREIITPRLGELRESFEAGKLAFRDSLLRQKVR
jgi:hypothetical protein